MAHRSGEYVNLTIRVDSGVLMLAKHRALLERTTVNQHLVQSPSEADLTPYQTSIRVHDNTSARDHEDTPDGSGGGSASS